jgi:hypothetical protein
MWPLHGFAVVAVLNCLLWFRVGHYPVTLARRHRGSARLPIYTSWASA